MQGECGGARQAFAHEAVLDMAPDSDIGAPGAAITVELCGHWQHEPPCPVAPHHTDTVRVGEDVRLRILFAAEAEQESAVRQVIETALARGRLTGPDGGASEWQVRSSGRAVVGSDQQIHAQRLVAS